MSGNIILEGILLYLYFIPILTLHEFGHAWMASKLGDNTARSLGRVTLNPVSHIDPIGTIALPALAIILGSMNSALAGFIIGWGKPVPVNVNNLKNRQRDDVLIALAGPAMNIIFAFCVLLFYRLVSFSGFSGVEAFYELSIKITYLSLFLCFFNLLPIPPLDGSHVLRHLIKMSDELYYKMCRYGFFILILVIQIPFVWTILRGATFYTFRAIAWLVKFPTL